MKSAHSLAWSRTCVRIGHRGVRCGIIAAEQVRTPPRGIMSAFDLARRLGIRVVEVTDLPDPILYLPEQHMALVDADLTDEARVAASDWLLGAVASRV